MLSLDTFHYFSTGEMMEEKKRGGARAGSGRKPTGRLKIFANTTISGTPEEIEHLKELAKKNGKTVSRFVMDLVADYKDK